MILWKSLRSRWRGFKSLKPTHPLDPPRYRETIFESGISRDGSWSDELLYGKREEEVEKSRVFARTFEELTDQDQQEILNLIEFKRLMKEQRNRNAEQR
jgi:hypothetical protein